MSTSFYRRRNIINEGTVYKASDLFKTLTESIDERDFLTSDQKIPHEYRLYDPHMPVDPNRDIKKLCERDLLKMSGPSTEENNVISPEELNITDEIPSVYCKLYTIYQYIDTDVKKDEFIDNLSRVFWFIRPNVNDNRVKFHSLMKTILNSENPEESIRTLSDKIKTTYYQEGSDEDTTEAQDIRNALSQLKGQKNLTNKEIEQYLNLTKNRSYNLYEKSFEKGPFKRINKIYNLKYREALEEKGFKKLLDKAYNQIYASTDSDIDYYGVIEGLSDKLITAIHSLYRKGDAVKADLVALQDIKDINGFTVIPSGGYVEVKMRDYHLDSYLSEYFSIYKESDIHPKYKTNEMVKIYNDVINSLYKKIKTSTLPILEDITSNFYGIFFGEHSYEGKMLPVFIPSKYIDIYWSNKGKVETTKQLRLSIRYRLNSESLEGYLYDRERSIFIPTNFSNKVTDKKVFGESVIGKSLLLEGRVENVKKRYPNVPEEIIQFFVENDPSGNQKYLMWLVSMWDNEEVRESLVDWGSDSAEEGLYDIISDFHELLPYIEKKDIYQYKVSWDTIDELYDTIEKAENIRIEKEREKSLKKDRVIIFENPNWLVVSPKSHEASCHYGAGTRWCITTRNNPEYFRKYTYKSTFFFIINKNLTKDNPEYKTAYRLIGYKPRVELWDAEDMEFSNTRAGKEYLESIPQIIKSQALEYHKTVTLKGESGTDGEDPKIEALHHFLGEDSSISEYDEPFYGLSTYVDDNDPDGIVYAVGTESECNQAIGEKLMDTSVDILLGFIDPDATSLMPIPEEIEKLSEYLSDRFKIPKKELIFCFNLGGSVGRCCNEEVDWSHIYQEIRDYVYIDYNPLIADWAGVYDLLNRDGVDEVESPVDGEIYYIIETYF